MKDDYVQASRVSIQKVFGNKRQHATLRCQICWNIGAGRPRIVRKFLEGTSRQDCVAHDKAINHLPIAVSLCCTKKYALQRSRSPLSSRPRIVHVGYRRLRVPCGDRRFWRGREEGPYFELRSTACRGSHQSMKELVGIYRMKCGAKAGPTV
jgi:hypothetical protein